MKKILAFAGSNHSKSINYQLVNHTASLVEGAAVEVLDIRDWDVAMYSIDMDPDQTPEKITELIELIGNHDGFIIASPEHNGGMPAFLKNIMDWLSRRGNKVFSGKPVFLISTSPGGKGGANNLNTMAHVLPYQGANVVTSFSLPSFYDNFKEGRVVDGSHLTELKASIEELKVAINAKNKEN